MAYNFYAGSTFNYTGTFQLSGSTPGGTSGVNGNQPDFSQWAVTAGMYDQTGEKLICALNVTNCSVPTYPQSNGLFILNATADQTKTWPLGKAQLSMKAITQDGSTLIPDPQWFRIQAAPVAQGGN